MNYHYQFGMIKATENKQPTVELHDGEFMTIDGVLHSIISHHSFDDFGGPFKVRMDTFKVINYAGLIREIYSFDECETFTFDNGE